jgi:hypothetical protein
METDSESSCTYKDYITAYASTNDSKLWHVQYVVSTTLNLGLGAKKVPVTLCDEPMPEDLKEVASIGPQELEEMTMEPLFSVPLEYQLMLESTISYKKDSIVVSASSYGIKCLIFSLSGCIMCVKSEGDMEKASICVPQRFFKKIAIDCGQLGVECELRNSRPRPLYSHVDLSLCPEALRNSMMESQRYIMSTTRPRTVMRSVTPVFADGFRFYYPIDLMMLLMLAPSVKTKSIDESGNIVVHKSKRCMQVVPLSIREPIKRSIKKPVEDGNDVASQTSPTSETSPT